MSSAPPVKPELAASCEQLAIRFPEELPIVRHVDEIREAWSRRQVIIVGGDTGSGKTT